MNDGGKGSAPRPILIDMDKFDENWDKIFGECSTDHGPECEDPDPCERCFKCDCWKALGLSGT
jgi:hypothetical protein